MLLEKEIQVSPAEFQMWKEHPTTLSVFQALEAERSLWVERLAWGDTIAKPDMALKETALAVGVIQGITTILEGLETTMLQQWDEAQRRKEEESEVKDD